MSRDLQTKQKISPHEASSSFSSVTLKTVVFLRYLRLENKQKGAAFPSDNNSFNRKTEGRVSYLCGMLWSLGQYNVGFAGQKCLLCIETQRKQT